MFTDPCIEHRCEFTDILGLDWRIDLEVETANGTFPVKDPALWNKFHCTYTYKLYTTTTTDSYISRIISLNGATHPKISIKYKVASGTPGNGQIFYETAGHGRSASYYKAIYLIADGEYHTLIVDMSKLTAGGTDWINNTITKIYFDLTDNHPVVINLDWIGFTMQAMGDPLYIEFLAKSDRLHDNPIRGSMAHLFVYADIDFQYAEFYAVQDMQFRTSIYQGAEHDLYWRGFITSDNYSEPYDGVPYPVKISSADGLGMLKNISYDDDGTPYNGRILESQIVLDILAKIGITGFTEYVNIYEEQMHDEETDSPFDQIKIDVDIFRSMNCYDVLEKLLIKYFALIRQVAGKMIIYRPVELIQTTVYGRIFTDVTTKTGTSFTPKQYIDRKGYSSTLHDVEGGQLRPQFTAKKVIINQDYGHKESWIDNHKFKADTFTGSFLIGYDCDFWTASTSGIISPINKALPGKTDGIVIKYNDYPSTSRYIQQTFSENALYSADDVFKLEFDYLYHNLSGSDKNPVYFYIEIISDEGHYLHIGLDDKEYGEWHAYQDEVIIGDTAPVGTPEWKHYERKIIGLPADGNYCIKIYGAVNAYGDLVWTGIKDLRFYCTSEKIVFIKRKKKLTGWEWIRRNLFNPFPKPWPTELIRRYEDIEEVVEEQYVKENDINGIEIEIDS